MNRPFRSVPLDLPAESTDVALPPAPDELVKLFYAIESMRRGREPSVLQLVAPGAGQGTSTIASMLARIAAASRERSVLLLDCGDPGVALRGTRTITEAFRAGLPLKQTATSQGHDGLHRWAQLSVLPRKLLDLPPDGLREMFDLLRQAFDLVLLDTPAASVTPDAAALSRYCDGTILVVQAEQATTEAVQALRRDIELVGGQVVGAVLNRQRRHIPRWLQRRLQ